MKGASERGDQEPISAKGALLGGMGRGVAMIDFVLRVFAIIGTLGSAIAMGTTDKALPFFTPFVRFRAKYSNLPSLTFFVAANSVVCGYLVLSLLLSIYHILRHGARSTRLVLVLFDTVMMALLTAGASAAAAIVYLAHNGNVETDWLAICHQFNSFCERISGSLIGSFGAIVIFILLIFLSTATIARV